MTDQLLGDYKVRPMTHADLELVLNWRNHPDVRSYMYTRNKITLGEHLRWFERTVKDGSKHLLIFEIDTKPFGFVNFSEFAYGKIADWGFYVAPDASKGIGKQLGKVALNYAFNQLKLRKICGQALAYNERSIRLHQFLGFQQEGVLRDHFFDGENYHQIICFGLLNHEWRANS